MINLLQPWALTFLSVPSIAILLRNRIYIDVVTDQLAAEGLVCGASGVAEIAKFSWKPPSLLIVFSETTTLIQKYWNIFILSNLTEISSDYITILVNLDHSHILLWRKSFIDSWRHKIHCHKLAMSIVVVLEVLVIVVVGVAIVVVFGVVIVYSKPSWQALTTPPPLSGNAHMETTHFKRDFISTQCF